MSSNHRKSFICTEGGKHNHTPTQAHTSGYSRHPCHILESVGRHRRDTLRRKIQVMTLRGAGACAHERRTGVVAAERAIAKGQCPRDRHARQGALVLFNSLQQLGTERRALHQIVEGKDPVGRRRDRVQEISNARNMHLKYCGHTLHVDKSKDIYAVNDVLVPHNAVAKHASDTYIYSHTNIKHTPQCDPHT